MFEFINGIYCNKNQIVVFNIYDNTEYCNRYGIRILIALTFSLFILDVFKFFFKFYKSFTLIYIYIILLCLILFSFSSIYSIITFNLFFF